MNQELKPVYISNTPDGVDELKGKSHEKIANEICKVILNQSKIIKRQIIGLEGDWGSGKSNIIKKVENDLDKEKFYHFIFDSWGHQEDLNRRAILEEIIDFLEIKNPLLIDKEWKSKRKQLSGKTVNSKKNSYPEIKSFWILFFLGIFLYGFFKEAFPYFEVINFSNNFSNPLLKKLLILFLIPVLIFVFGFFELYEEYIKIKSEPKKEKISNKQVLGQLFSIIQGKETETLTTDFIIENEPSNKDFRSFLDFINKRLSENNLTLILTIDNIDRLTHDKIKSLWSTVNIFFADKSDDKYYDNVWLIIPYDDSKIADAFDLYKDLAIGLIEKTFSIKYRVPPPIPTNWEILFEDKLKLAFGIDIIPNDEVVIMKRIFDCYSKEIITPRQIINFINDLVTLYTINRDISFRYLSLFILAKGKIVGNPIQSILYDEYFETNIEHIFNEDFELQKNMSAITFGVPLEMAEEILYADEIQNIFKEGNVDELEKFKNNKIGFENNFFREFSKISLDDLSLSSYEKTPLLLYKIEDLELITKNQLDTFYWKNLKDFALNISNGNGKNRVFNKFHKEIFGYNIEYGKQVIVNLIDGLYYDINKVENEITYIDNLKEIDDFLIENSEINISSLLINPYNNRVLYAESYIHLVNQFPEYFDKLELRITEEILTKYYYDIGTDIKIDNLFNDINEVEIIKKTFDYNFSEIEKQIIVELESLKLDNLYNLNKYVEVLKILSKDKPIKFEIPKISIPSGFINLKPINDDNFICLICLTFKNLDLISNYQPILDTFNSNDLVLAQKVATKIEFYISYADLLEMVIDTIGDYQLIKNVIIEITKKSYGTSRLDMGWVVNNFSKISKMIFNDEINNCNLFYARIDGGCSLFEKHLNESNDNFAKIDLTLMDYAIKIDNKLSKLLLLKSNEYLNGSSSIGLIQIIENFDFFENNLYKKLSSKNKIDEKFEVKLQIKLLSFLEDFSLGKIRPQINSFSNFRLIFSKIKSSEQIIFYKKIATIISKSQTFDENQTLFFINGILDNNLLSKTNSLFIKNFIISSKFKQYFYEKSMYKSIIDIVSKTNNTELKSLIWEKVKLGRKGNLQKEYAIKKGLKLK